VSAVDDQIARSRAMLQRVTADYRGGGGRDTGASRARRQQVQDLGKRVKRIADADWSPSPPFGRASTMVRLSPGAPSRIELTLWTRRTGRLCPLARRMSRSSVSVRFRPGAGCTDWTSAIPSPATRSAILIERGTG
jgi:hypothetical protein